MYLTYASVFAACFTRRAQACIKRCNVTVAALHRYGEYCVTDTVQDFVKSILFNHCVQQISHFKHQSKRFNFIKLFVGELKNKKRQHPKYIPVKGFLALWLI